MSRIENFSIIGLCIGQVLTLINQTQYMLLEEVI